MVAEKQRTFNEAVDKLTKEKDVVIADLRSRLETRETTETFSQTTENNLASGRDSWGSARTLPGLQAALTQSADSSIQDQEHVEAYARIQDSVPYQGRCHATLLYFTNIKEQGKRTPHL